ncbi:MAG: hypothetical protein H6747_13760 [Deltaproteobacteria bacterium]|nr:hypothetical protein [Deltaproteobacteria bacterium]
MRPLIIAFAVVVAGCGAARPSPATTSDTGDAGDGSLEEVAFLSGSWRARPEGGEGALTRERWSAPRNGVMLGVGRVDEAGSLAFFEFLRLARTDEPDCRVAYFASPMGKPAVRFCLAERGPGRVVFRNPDHDDPQEIGYAREGDGLAVWTRSQRTVDGTQQLRLRRWRMLRDR